MLGPEHLAALLKLVVRNGQSVDVLFGVVNDFACLIESRLERCSHLGCEEPASVRHLGLGLRYCDYHAARIMMKARKNVGRDGDLNMNLLRAQVMDEEAWVDLPDAHRIRRLRDYVLIIKRNDEPDPPENREEMH